MPQPMINCVVSAGESYLLEDLEMLENTISKIPIFKKGGEANQPILSVPYIDGGNLGENFYFTLKKLYFGVIA